MQLILVEDVFRFEDLVLQYDLSTSKQLDFLGFPSSVHVNKKKYFNPVVSSKNNAFGVNTKVSVRILLMQQLKVDQKNYYSLNS